MDKNVNTTVVVQLAESKSAKKVNKRPFELKEKCQDFSAEIFVITSVAQKEYRLSICRKVQDLSCELIHAVRLANGCKLGGTARKKAQRDALEMIERLFDLLPVLTKCKCMTPEQQEKLEKKLKAIKISCDSWLEKDMERIEQIRANKPSDSSV